MAEKEQWWPKRSIFYCEPWRSYYHWGLIEDAITEDPEENPINGKPKEDTVTEWDTYRQICQYENPQELQGH